MQIGDGDKGGKISRWIAVEHCPGCGGAPGRSVYLAGAAYRFGGETIPYPEGGVRVYSCEACGLRFKSPVPSPEHQAEVFRRLAGRIWAERYAFRSEARAVEALAGGNPFDLLDVGPSGGALLEACPGGTGRRSALDVVRHPGVERALRGEFIDGALDDPALDWSGEPYDVVALFDVLEHLHRPGAAWENLGRLVRPGGWIVLETGDAESGWPRRFGIGEWHYAAVFPHHVFWSESSLRRYGARHGFSLVETRRKRHKTRLHASWGALAAVALRTLCYSSAPGVYRALARLAGKEGAQPRSPFARDHLWAVMRRKD